MKYSPAFAERADERPHEVDERLRLELLMADLSAVHKVFIVQQLAMGDSYQVVANLVNEFFGITVSRQLVYKYDPIANPSESKKGVARRALYDETRTKFLESIDEIPTSNRAVRIRRLERMAGAAEAARNFALAGQLLEQIAKEQGDVYTNTRNLKHSGSVGIEALLDEGDPK